MSAVLQGIASYRRSLAEGERPLPALWLWNMDVAFRWGCAGESAFDRGGRSHDQWPELGVLACLLAEEGDTLIDERTGEEGLDRDLLAIWREAGADLPEVSLLPVHVPDPERSTAFWLRQSSALESWNGGADPQGILVCFGNSREEEALAADHRFLLFGGPAAAAQRCNDKVLVKAWCGMLGLASPEGEICRSTAEVETVAADLLARYPKVVVKKRFGASGKGLLVTGSLERVRRALKETGEAVLVERWYERRSTHNSQWLILPDGEARFLGVTEQILDQQKYQGNRMTADSSHPLSDEIAEQQRRLLDMACREGYHGILGIDSFIAADGEVMPAVEINARFNLSTYALALLERLGYPGEACLKSYMMRWPRKTTVDELVSSVGEDLWYRRGAGRGVIPVVFSGRSSPDRLGILRLAVLILGENLRDVETSRQSFETSLAAWAPQGQ